MVALLTRLGDATLVRYLLASIGALAVDVGLFLALLPAGVSPAVSSALGYCAGIVAHWLLSSRAVFVDSIAASGFARTRQKMMFVVSALIGLVVTTAVVAALAGLGVDPRGSKLVAIGVSFVLTWVLRQKVVFR